MKKTDSLFQEFEAVSAKEWKQQIQVELKGLDYNDTLVWQSLEGIDVKPFYTVDQYTYLKIPEVKEPYQIGQQIHVDDEKKSNEIANQMLSAGADSIILIFEKSIDLKVLFDGLEVFNNARLFCRFHELDEDFIKKLMSFSDALNINLQIDILGHFAQSGNWYLGKEEDHQIVVQLLEKYPDKDILFIDASVYHNAGANIVQQLAFALSHIQEYVLHFGKKVQQKLYINFGIGSNYFFEIAKFRAFRYLLNSYFKEYDLKTEGFVMAQPGLRNKTIYDHHVNLLRTTSEYMSAVIGGVELIQTFAHDALFKKSNEFSNRIARNQLLVLREENALDSTEDYALDSYFIESITSALAQKSLALFKEIEKEGGFYKKLKTGQIQKMIHQAAAKEQLLFDEGKIHLIGTNIYPNPEEKLKDEIEIFPFMKKKKHQTEIVPVLPKRLAEKIEEERLNQE